MDKLNIDFKSLLPYVIDAFSSVYGEEYKSIISEKIKNAIIVSYHDVEGLNDYVSYLKKCKSRELSIRFLEEAGIDVQVHKKGNYTEPLDSNIRDILGCFIEPDFGFSVSKYRWSPLLAFDSNNKKDPEQLLKNKLKLINYLLDNNYDKITEENFEAFTKTEEYSQLLIRINYLKKIYEELISEYDVWEKKLSRYKKYIEDEENRKTEILQKKKDELFREIYEQLPLPVKEYISDKSFEEQQVIVFGLSDISAKTNIEEFHDGKMEKLKSPNTKYWDKYMIMFQQSVYLKKLGVTIPDEILFKCNSDEEIANYLSFINQEDIKKYIPSEDLIKLTSSIREKKYEEALREYYTTRKDFIDAMKDFADDKMTIKFIYERIKNRDVCATGGEEANGDFFAVMFYSIRAHDGGYLCYYFMHECGHIIDQSIKGSGFDSFEVPKNPYDNAYRKYERFNEALNDILTSEAIYYLQNQGIYLIEAKEFTQLDYSNINTVLIIRNLLQPLLQKYRKQVIKAKINSEPQELINYIGEDNFEELVDAVNKVNYLARNGVIPKIDNSPEDDMVIEYFKQVERVKQIYINIDNYDESKSEELLIGEAEETSKRNRV